MNAPCERLAEIASAESEGRMLPAADLAFRQQHLASCAACRHEAQAHAALRMPDNGPAHFPASPADRARTIDAVLALVDLPDAPLADEWVESKDLAPAPAPVLPFARRARKPALWAAGLAAAAAAFLVFVRPPVPNGPAPSARVLLASAEGLSAGVQLAEGQEVAATGGETSLALGPDIVVLLEPGARAKIARLTPSGIELALSNGRVHASVKPNTPGPRLAVSTREGRVEVTGTLFSVEASESGSDLKVLRGSVKVSAAGRRTTRVVAQQGQRLGGEDVRTLTAAEQEMELAAMRRIALLETGEASVLQVRSSPPGARVTLDGEALGATPLSAEVKPGRRHVVVATASRTAEAWVDLHAGRPEVQDFDLKPVVARVDPEPEQPVRPEPRRPSVAGHAPANELLARAQALRHQRAWGPSAAVYKELLGAYPAFDEGAYVSYGELLVDHLGDPKGALRACGRYLDRSPGGVVAAEAMSCRIRALRALGRAVDERAAIGEFLERFPSAVQAPELRRRAAELR